MTYYYWFAVQYNSYTHNSRQERTETTSDKSGTTRTWY